MPGYEERTELASKLASEASEKTLDEVTSIIRENLSKSAQKLVELTDHNDPSISLQAVKHHLKLGGLEQENVKHDHTIKITSTQADKIEKAVSLMEAAQ